MKKRYLTLRLLLFKSAEFFLLILRDVFLQKEREKANSVNLYPPRSDSGLVIIYLKFHNILFTGYQVRLIMAFKSFKSNKSYTTDTSMTTMSWQYQVIASFMRFHSVCLSLLTFKQFKGNNSLHAGAILIKWKMHQCVMVIHIECKFLNIL